MDHFKEAVNLASLGRLEEAKKVFEEILLEDSKNADVLCLGRLLRCILGLARGTQYLERVGTRRGETFGMIWTMIPFHPGLGAKE